MWLKKIKKKKFQFALVSLMLCFTSTIFAACISFVAEVSYCTNDYTSYQNCPRVIATADEKYDGEYFAEYEELMAKTEEIHFCDVMVLPQLFYFDGAQMKTASNRVYVVENINDFMHTLKLLEGTGIAPGYGEIWINSVSAEEYGIEVGDTVTYGETKGQAFLVSGIVATPVCPSSYFGEKPSYIGAESEELLEGDKLRGISFFSSEDMSSETYIKLLPEVFCVEATSFLDADGIHLGIASLADIFGGVGLLAAVIIFIVSLIVIRFIIQSTLAKEYREIGTYKALGFTERQIVGFYLKSFLVAGGAGVVIGAAGSFPIAEYLCNMVLKNLGTFHLSMLSVVLAGAAAILLFLFLALGVFWSLHKIRKITPVEAFSSDSMSSKKKIGKSLIRSAYSPLSVAVNDIARKKGTSLINILVLTIAFYMTLLFLSVDDSLSKFGEMTGEWFALPQYDGIIAIQNEEETRSFLDDSESVKHYTLTNLDISMSGMKTDYDVDISNGYIEIYNDCTQESLGLPLIEGRHPENEEEILMSYDFAMQTGHRIGDWFHMENEEYENDYLITGLVSSMYNGGLNMLMDGEEYAKYQRGDNYKNAYVFLKDGVTYGQFEAEAKQQIEGCVVSRTESFLEGSVNSLTSVSGPLTQMFAIVFSCFAVLNIVNLLLMNNIENRRQYGILKAMGFTNGYLCLKNLLRIVILTAIAAALAYVLHMTCSQKLFFAIIHVNGLVYKQSLTMAVIVVLSALIALVTLLFTIPMRKIAPTELMED